MMRTGKQTLFPFGKPLFSGDPSALRAASMAAGVVSDFVYMSVWAAIDMPAQGRGSALHDHGRLR
jgi:hypothetical protein